MLKKLFREARKTWLAKDNTDTSDHLFNFCITSTSLRDWVLKSLNLDGHARDLYFSSWRNAGYFGVCADIANSLKHFGLDATRKTHVSTINSHVEQLVAIGLGGNLVEGVSLDKSFFSICLDDERKVDLLVLLFHVCKNWEEHFKLHNIPRGDCPNYLSIFVEYV